MILAEKFNRLLGLLLIAMTFHLATRPACAQVSLVSAPLPPDGSKFNVYILIEYETGDGTNLTAPLLSLTDGSNAVTFQQIYYGPNASELDFFQITVPADVLTNSVTLTWTNFSMNLPVVKQPYYSVIPTNQSAFVGTTATFSATATHTTGYQWQHDGTNMLADGHYFGVTNSTLTISNLQLADAGLYTVIANHPLNPGTESASLSVYKPIVLGLLDNSAANRFTLTIANQDGSPLESERVTNLQIFTITNLPADNSSWNEETNTGAISNGILQVAFPNDGNLEKFWRVLEQ